VFDSRIVQGNVSDLTLAIASVISGAFIIPWGRSKYSPQHITTFAARFGE
jgi:hypothetical protein